MIYQFLINFHKFENLEKFSAKNLRCLWIFARALKTAVFHFSKNRKISEFFAEKSKNFLTKTRRPK